jgi:hypothetical protein
VRQLSGEEAAELELTTGAHLTLDEAVELAFELARRAGARPHLP